MSQMVYDKIQLGTQTVDGTPVAATTVFPGKAAAPELDRGYRNPDEDYGIEDDEFAGRGAMGLRGASTSITGDVCDSDFMHILEMHHAGGISPTGTDPYTWVYTANTTTDTAKRKTIELGSETAQDQWRLTGCLVDELTAGFDALEAPGNMPWTFDASVVALDRSITALTGALSAPAARETFEGHLTTLAEGTVGTAFGSLSPLTASLVMFRYTSRRPWVRLPYGSASDVASAYGISEKSGITFEAQIKIGSTAKTDIHDNFNASGSPITEKRWRLVSSGSGTKTLTTDFRCRYRVVGRAERNGEAVYGIQGSMVKDATLGGRIQTTIVNSTLILP